MQSIEFASVIAIRNDISDKCDGLEIRIEKLQGNIGDYPTKKENQKARQELNDLKKKYRIASARYRYLSKIVEATYKELDKELKV
jgi:hypothetical protein